MFYIFLGKGLIIIPFSRSLRSLLLSSRLLRRRRWRVLRSWSRWFRVDTMKLKLASTLN
ncbi:unnamed protein product [Plutella xylostella]|uniref:(diamondback moth) hypothetical protein n=1 Tax=Plutella xylostella TaxID=51655 RepID=A0A8S4DUQ8_PLUXY|nr:unnamed protein product [Plutella xylostella]